jgi:hypothetical protein
VQSCSRRLARRALPCVDLAQVFAPAMSAADAAVVAFPRGVLVDGHSSNACCFVDLWCLNDADGVGIGFLSGEVPCVLREGATTLDVIFGTEVSVDLEDCSLPCEGSLVVVVAAVEGPFPSVDGTWPRHLGEIAGSVQHSLLWSAERKVGVERFGCRVHGERMTFDAHRHPRLFGCCVRWYAELHYNLFGSGQGYVNGTVSVLQS